MELVSLFSGGEGEGGGGDGLTFFRGSLLSGFPYGHNCFTLLSTSRYFRKFTVLHLI